MNKLFILKNMGFEISWKLITIGLFGCDEIPISITHSDVVEYLDSLLMDVNEQTNDIITLICEKDNVMEFDNILKKLANKDVVDSTIQKRKWRAYLLKDLIDNISKDCLQGLLELMEFWVLVMGIPNDCPQTLPNNDNKKSVQNYFTQETYEFNVNKNLEWLNMEILNIQLVDKNRRNT